ncbi:hypothetical protein AGMMS50262_16490 [Bacteroidia bacterium]|nr:hypothetical protein AGMMS50262_16490 [Bacteroidia bacterium]
MNGLNKWVILACQCLLVETISAQTIEIDLPPCSGLQYSVIAMEGMKQDTVLNGRMAEAGKTVIVLPAQYANYRGVGRLAIKECKSINLILNGEELIVIKEVRGYDNIEVTFDKSEENRFIDDVTARQRQLLEKYQYVLSGLSEFQMKDQMYPALRQEQMGLENQYVALQKEIRNSPLYAGRLVEMLNCLTGTGSSLTQSAEDVRKEQQKYISDRLNFLLMFKPH